MAENVIKREIDGKSYDIVVTNAGMFWVRLSDQEQIEAPTLKGLVDKILATVRKRQRPAVEATIVEEPRWGEKKFEVEDVLVTGIHAGNGNVLVKRANGRTEQFNNYNKELLRRLTKKEATEVRAAYEERDRTQKAYSKLIKSLKLDVRKALGGEDGEE